MDQNFQNQLEQMKEADLLIGIPSYNSTSTIGQVVKTVQAGVTKYFPKAKAVLIVSEGGSPDAIREELTSAGNGNLPKIITSHVVDPIHRMVSPYHGVPGKENGIRKICEATQWLNAKCCAVVNSDSRSMTPGWIQFLLRPIYEEDFDYVVPIYSRHKFDGTITNRIIYPLNRALYGKKVRQYIGGDFGFSRDLAELYLKKDAWETNLVRFGVDVWMTTLAISEGYKICQSFLGPSLYQPKDSESDLGSVFSQILSSVYALMESYQNVWKQIKETEPVPTFGRAVEMSPDSVFINVQGMIRNFRLGMKNLIEIWTRVLPPETLLALESIGRLTDEAFVFPESLWVQLVYDFAIAYQNKVINRDHLLRSMIPLYLGQVASFVKENQEGSPEDVEENIESLCRRFEQMKSHLIEHWDWGNESKGGGGDHA